MSPLPTIRCREIESVPDWPEVPPLLARVLAGRGITDPAELALGLDTLPPPHSLPGIDDAVALLRQAREQQWKVLVVGDYDADGATATTVLLRGLGMLGLEQVSFLVPDRFAYGYGLSPEIVALAVEQGAPDLLVTVDNGISSIDGVAAAREAGIRVLVTDHHLPGEQLPDAEALLNPRLDPRAPGQHLAGVGVAFYLLMALRAALREEAPELARAPLAELLDLVALGTVADVVPLDQPNRALVEQGLRRIRAGRACPGILALLEVANRSPEHLVAEDLGFAVGPRLNAAGRLGDMTVGIRCLLSEDPVRAGELALELDSINRERRGIEQGMREAAMEEVQRLRQQGEPLPPVLCLHDRGWHEGVVGILASRVKEATHRPVLAFAPAREPGMLKGSGRSIAGLHLRDALERVATRHPGLLEKFGGHAMAAGLTLASDALESFRGALRASVEEVAEPSLFEEVVLTDGALAEEEISLANAELLAHRIPWGQGFPAPCFEGRFEVLQHRIVGERHLKLVLGLPASGAVVDAIHFNAPVEALPARIREVEGVYRLDVNHFRGRRNLQLLFRYLHAR